MRVTTELGYFSRQYTIASTPLDGLEVGFGVWDSLFSCPGLRFRVKYLGIRVYLLGLRV